MSSERILINLEAVLNGNGFRDARRELLEVNGLEERLIKNNTTLSKPAKLGITNSIKEAKKEAEGLNSEANTLAEAFNRLKQTAAVATIAAIGAQAIQTVAKFERLESVLKNTLGSNSEAQKALSEIKAFAASTPFQVDEITDSYIKLTNRGLQPTKEELVKLGDIAASQGKSLDQFTEALLDATTGENERLKEFGIQATKAGDSVTFAFKGIQKTVANTPEAIKGALLSFGELAGVTGSMAAVSKTLEGQWSNLMDTVDDLFVSLGDRGLASAAKSVLGYMSSLVSTVGDYLRVPMADKVREEQVEVNRLVTAIIGQNEGSATRNALMAELGQKYPEILRFLDIENQSTTGLIAKLEELNAAYAQKITIAAFSDDLVKVEKKLGDRISENARLQKKYGSENAADEVRFRQERVAFYESEIARQKGLALATAKTAKEKQEIEARAAIATAKIIDLVNEDQLKRAIARAEAADKSRTRTAFKEEGGGIDLSQQTKDILRLSELQKEQDELLKESADIRQNIAQREAELLKTTAGKVVQGEKEKQAAKEQTAKVDEKAAKKAKAEAEKLAAENKKRDRELEKLRINGIEDETKRKIELVRFGLRTELEDYEGNAKQKAEFRKLKEAEATKAILQIQKEAYDKELKARKDLTDDVIDYEREARMTALELEIDTLKDIADPTLAQKKLLLQKERDLALLSNKERLDAELIQAEEYARKKAELTGEPLDIIGAQAPIETASQTREANIKAKFGLDIQEVDFEAARAEIESLEARLDSSVSESEIRQAGLLTSLEEQYTRGIISYADYEAQKTDILRDAELQRLQIQKDGLTKQLDSVNTLLASDTLTEAQRTELVKQQTDLRLELADVALKASEAANQVLKDTADKGIAKIEQQVNVATGLANSAIQIVQAVADFTKDKDAEVVDSQIENTKRRIDELLALESEANLQQVENEKIRLNQLVAAKEEAARKEQRIANIIAAAQYAVAVAEGSLAIAKQAQLPFPYNLVAIIGTVAALAAGGISLVSKFQATQQSAATGFYDGGYTGDKGEREVAGVVHGREFVVTAKKTKEFRPLLDAINTGKIKPSDLTTFAPNYNAATIVREQAATKIKDDDIIKEIRTTNKILSQNVQKSARDAVRENMKSKRV